MITVENSKDNELLPISYVQKLGKQNSGWEAVLRSPYVKGI